MGKSSTSGRQCKSVGRQGSSNACSRKRSAWREERRRRKRPSVAVAIEREAESRLGPKGIYPNVDFYSGLVYRKLGIPRDLFTPVFAIARVAGWLAHWREQLGANRIFRPSQIYSGSQPRTWISMDERATASAA